jgi:3-deoxy-7-phosphoheptulonate synthase
MILPYKEKLTDEQLIQVKEIAAEFGVTIQTIQGKGRSIYAMLGDETPALLTKRIEGLDYIDRIDHIQVPYKLLALENQHSPRVITVNNKVIGKDFIVMAGQCAIDPNNANYFLETAHAVKEAGADVIRGGVWKPRTSPYSFQGADKGMDILMQASKETGLEVITEVMDIDQVLLAVEAGVHFLQIGARNALNYKLLTSIGKLTADTNIKVLLKRSMHMGPIDEFLLAAEYIAGNGNSNVMLCPRGTLPAMTGYRNFPDESITQLLKEKTWAPVIVDPSHSVGRAKYVPKAALAAAAYGADGVIIETHCNPIVGMGDDPKQAITPDVLKILIKNLQQVAAFASEFDKPVL